VAFAAIHLGFLPRVAAATKKARPGGARLEVIWSVDEDWISIRPYHPFRPCRRHRHRRLVQGFSQADR